MPDVKAPYNFVPLNKDVFFPYWSEFVSQDVPFKDALSGKIKLKITAETPLFIRGKEDEKKGVFIDVANNNRRIEYSVYHPFMLEDQYCIPGTSIKGELESVLEILSFGKLKRINDSKYSIRDFFNEDLYDKFSFADSLGGWLSKNGHEYKIDYNIKKPGRITHQEIDSIFNCNFVDTFGRSFNARNSSLKAAKKKYDLLGRNSLIKEFGNPYNNGYREIYQELNGSCLQGTIVFTGQSSKRKIKTDKRGNQVLNPDGSPKMIGKHLEFIFWEPNNYIDVDKQVIKDFFFAYFDHDEKNQSIDWKYWKPKLDKGEKIPVFFQLDENEHVKHLGLSMLYKLPYSYRVKELIKNPDEHSNPELDFIETLFGYTPDENQKINKFKELKGRVSIEPALNTNTATVLPVVTTILGSPKASFYPYYLWQNPNAETVISGNYKTFMDDAELGGRKRYPVREVLPVTTNVIPSDVTVSFMPLDKGAEFETIIHYNNLRPVEMGALLSALTFHNTSECNHSLGMAKPLGYGNIKFEIDFEHSTIVKAEMPSYLGMFERVMNDFCPGWINSEQLRELLSIATPIKTNHPKIDHLKHLILEEFAEIKKEKKALQRYSQFMGINPNIQSFFNQSNFDVDNDTNLFKIDRPEIQDKINEYVNTKKEQIKQLIDLNLKSIEDEIKKNEEAEKSVQVDAFKKQGIQSLLDQTTMNDLISKTKWWIGKFYTKEDQKKIDKDFINIIPEKYTIEFLEHIQQIFEQKQADRAWKADRKKTLFYLIKCLGQDTADKWFTKNNI